jgi:hypothetical protein
VFQARNRQPTTNVVDDPQNTSEPLESAVLAVSTPSLRLLLVNAMASSLAEVSAPQNPHWWLDLPSG